ncbi:S-adenosyl-L-methionine-dependent methyltransferase [Choanephora cucurbitarum]|nr:S-adenosyl-L-methionine-dependent methyltransferase [Choanephora cucurbitarum]
MTELKQNIDWEKKWQEGQTGWDSGEASPALKALFENEETKSLIPEGGRGLVPGCGSASKDRHMTGMDFSQTCADMLQKKYPDAAAQNYDFVCADFYNFSVPDGGYDLAYDYTFLCAMDLHMRPAWGKRYAEIMRKGGVLITLMYPIDGHEGGPPFAVDESV